MPVNILVIGVNFRIKNFRNYKILFYRLEIVYFLSLKMLSGKNIYRKVEHILAKQIVTASTKETYVKGTVLPTGYDTVVVFYLCGKKH